MFRTHIYIVSCLLSAGLLSATSIQPEKPQPAPAAPTAPQEKKHNTRGGNVIVITSAAQFKSLINSGQLVIVDFYNPDCGPCKKLKPIFAQVAAECNDVIFVTVNVYDENLQSLVAGIRSVPTVRAYKNGNKIGEFSGFRDADAMSAFVNKMLNT